MKSLLKVSLLFVIALVTVNAQYSDPNLITIGYHTGNRAGISFYNDGQIAGFNTGTDIRGEWPLGSGENYIGDCIPLIGVEFVNALGDTLQSVIISRGPRNGQGNERHPTLNYFWGWNPTPGFRNPNYQSVAMSHIPDSWPISGWRDPVAGSWRDAEGRTEWFGYFGRGIVNADQESFFEADDHWDDEFNSNFKPSTTDPNRNGMGLRMRQRGFQWSSFLAEDAVFWLYDITNDGTTLYRKANFGTVVGTLAGGDGDSQDDLGYFDIDDWITYSYDSDGIGNRNQRVGYVGYAFLESPGNPFDGIDNDNDADGNGSPKFQSQDFMGIVYDIGDKIVLIDPVTYERSIQTITQIPFTVSSMGVEFILDGVTPLREGHIAQITNGVAIPHKSANDGIDNDLDGLIDENEATHLVTREGRGLQGLSYINYTTGEGVGNLMIDEKRDNNVDEDMDWDPLYDDLGQDGLGPDDDNYPGSDLGEGDGIPTQGEPNFGKTDTDESDQIGLTGFNFFENSASPNLSIDSLVWNRMTPGRFDVVPPQPMDGDFIYSSGFFPLNPATTERFSVSLLFGENYRDIVSNKEIVQQIYNSGYKFPQAPAKPEIQFAQDDGKVVIYWDGTKTENSRDFITKIKDFQGYKIYRSTDSNFRDARVITNALGVLSFDLPIAQFDLVDSISGFYYPSQDLLTRYGGITYYLGENTGITNTFVDSTVVPGIKYYYAVTAYDAGYEDLEIFPEENSKFIFRTSTGEFVLDDNTGYITPARRPLAYVPASSTEMERNQGFIGTGNGIVDIVDDASVRNGYRYNIVFTDTSIQRRTETWSLIDLQTPDTVYVPLLNEVFIVNPFESIQLPAGTTTITVNSRDVLVNNLTYTASYDTLINRSSDFTGYNPVHQGFTVRLFNDPIAIDTSRSGFQNISSASSPTYTFTRFSPNNEGPNGRYRGIDIANDYEIEFFSSNVTRSVADTLWPATVSNRIPAQDVNFTVKNLTTGQDVDFVYFKTGSLSTIHNIYFKENLYGEIWRTWRLNIFYNSANQPLESSGKLLLRTRKPFTSDDVFNFTITSASIDNNSAKDQLDKIKVVPNPYVVTHAGEERLLSTQTSGRGEREIRFTHIPPGSKITIYTVRGELIKTLEHNDIFTGDVYWNLRTDENIDVSFGVYVYVVEVPEVGKKIDKFALIK